MVSEYCCTLSFHEDPGCDFGIRRLLRTHFRMLHFLSIALLFTLTVFIHLLTWLILLFGHVLVTLFDLIAPGTQLATDFLTLAFLLDQFLDSVALVGQVHTVPSGGSRRSVMMTQHVRRFELFESLLTLFARGGLIGS